MPGWIGPGDTLVLLIVVLLLFGPQRLPQVGRMLGRGLRDFRSALADIADDGALPRPEEPPARAGREPRARERRPSRDTVG